MEENFNLLLSLDGAIRGRLGELRASGWNAVGRGPYICSAANGQPRLVFLLFKQLTVASELGELFFLGLDLLQARLAALVFLVHVEAGVDGKGVCCYNYSRHEAMTALPSRSQVFWRREQDVECRYLSLEAGGASEGLAKPHSARVGSRSAHSTLRAGV